VSETLTYALVTAARDEARNLPRLGNCVAEQTLLPARWMIVENGSSDDTLAVARELAAEHEWVRVTSLTGEAAPTRGGPIARAFEAGLGQLDLETDVVVIVDADVTLGSDYFERLMEKFATDPRLGMASGSRYELNRGQWRRHEVAGSTTVEGQCRAYRWACLADVLPLDDFMGWDGIDAVKATVAGWQTTTFRDFGYRHHRPIGTRDGTRARAWAEEGRGAYYMGYRFYYVVLRALHHARHEFGAFGLVWGYIESALRRAPRCPDAAVVAYVRRDQSPRQLLGRIREATGRIAPDASR
jgi:glycosyltransferase involved in cell wall biosynthesis